MHAESRGRSGLRGSDRSPNRSCMWSRPAAVSDRNVLLDSEPMFCLAVRRLKRLPARVRLRPRPVLRLPRSLRAALPHGVDVTARGVLGRSGVRTRIRIRRSVAVMVARSGVSSPIDESRRLPREEATRPSDCFCRLETSEYDEPWSAKSPSREERHENRRDEPHHT